MIKLINSQKNNCTPTTPTPRPRPKRTHELLQQLEPRLLLSATLASILGNHGDAGTTGLNPNELLLNPTSIASTQSNTATTFGRLFDTTLDGQVFAQPLTLSNVNIGGSSATPNFHNIIIVATMHDSLYAVDANTGAILWQDSFLQIANPVVSTFNSPVPTAGVTTIPAVSGDNALVNGSDIGPELGILATPAIDPATGIIYVEASTQEKRNGSTPSATGSDIHFVQRLWAINSKTGAVAITPTNPAVEPPSGGMVIGDTIYNSTSFSSYSGYQYVVGPFVKGTGDNGVNNNATRDGWITDAQGASTPWGTTSTPEASEYIAFNALLQMNRVATTLINGEIYLGFASHGDDGPYYGWLLGYNASTLANNMAYVSAPTFESFNVVSGDRSDFDSQAGFWNAGSTITTDGTYLYISTGNGAFNPNTNNFSSSFTSSDNGHTVQLPLDDDYGDAVLKLQLDLNANQNNINVTGGVINNPLGTYDPDGGYDTNGYGLKVVDFFVASNVFEMNLQDEDIGSSGVTLIPSTGPGSATAPNGDPMLVTSGKEGRIYLIDADNLGGYNTKYITDGHETTAADPAPYDNVLGEYYYFEAQPGNSGTKANNQTDKGYDIPSYFNGELYIGLGGGTTGTRYNPEIGFAISSLLFPASVPQASRTSIYATPNFTTGNSTNSPLFGGRGTTASISSTSTTSVANEIIWNTNVTQSSSDALIAYNSSGAVLFNSNWDISGQSNNTSDSLENGNANSTGIKFGVPTVSNGLVYVGTGGGSGTGGHILGTITGYGFLTALLHAPTSPLATLTSSTDVHLTWSRTSSDEESQDIIQRSTNGTNWNTIQILPNGSTSYDDTTITAGTNYFYRIEEAYGTKTPLASTSVQISTSPPAQLLSAVSEKIQGSGTLDLPINLTGPVSEDPRQGGPTRIIFTFDQPVTLPSGSFSLGLSSGSGNAITSGNTVIVGLAGAANNQILTITLTNLLDSGGHTLTFSLQIKAVLGDTNLDGHVDIQDLTAVANNWQQTASGPSEGDLDGSGFVDIADLTVIANNWQAGTNTGGGGGGSSASENLTPALSGATSTTTTPAHKTPAVAHIPPLSTDLNNQLALADSDNDFLRNHFHRNLKILLSKISRRD